MSEQEEGECPESKEEQIIGPSSADSKSVVDSECSLAIIATLEWSKEMMQVLEKVFNKPEAEWFLTPVDWEALQLPDYPLIITKPMDLGTVRNKLLATQSTTSDDASKIYSSIEACASDIRQIWCNAMVYNSPGSVVYVAAHKLSEYFENEFSAVANALQHTVVGDDPATQCPVLLKRPPTLSELSMWLQQCKL